MSNATPEDARTTEPNTSRATGQATRLLPREERDRLFLKLHKQGMTLSAISYETGSAEETVRRVLHRQGVTWKRRPDAKKPGRKTSNAMAQAMCNECGNVRTAKAIYFCSRGWYDRMLRCAVCRCGTRHAPIRTDPESDYGERLNAKVNEQGRRARRALESYDPAQNAAERYPDWDIRTTVTIRGELLDGELKLIKINPANAGPDVRWRTR
jgi:hypothetical protein